MSGARHSVGPGATSPMAPSVSGPLRLLIPLVAATLTPCATAGGLSTYGYNTTGISGYTTGTGDNGSTTGAPPPPAPAPEAGATSVPHTPAMRGVDVAPFVQLHTAVNTAAAVTLIAGVSSLAPPLAMTSLVLTQSLCGVAGPDDEVVAGYAIPFPFGLSTVSVERDDAGRGAVVVPAAVEQPVPDVRSGGTLAAAAATMLACVVVVALAAVCLTCSSRDAAAAVAHRTGSPAQLNMLAVVSKARVGWLLVPAILVLPSGTAAAFAGVKLAGAHPALRIGAWMWLVVVIGGLCVTVACGVRRALPTATYVDRDRVAPLAATKGPPMKNYRRREFCDKLFHGWGEWQVDRARRRTPTAVVNTLSPSLMRGTGATSTDARPGRHGSNDTASGSQLGTAAHDIHHFELYKRAFTHFRPLCRYGLLLQIVCVVVLSHLVAASAAVAPGGCVTELWVSVTVTAGYALFVMCARPYIAPIRNVAEGAISVALAAMLLCHIIHIPRVAARVKNEAFTALFQSRGAVGAGADGAQDAGGAYGVWDAPTHAAAVTAVTVLLAMCVGELYLHTRREYALWMDVRSVPHRACPRLMSFAGFWLCFRGVSTANGFDYYVVSLAAAAGLARDRSRHLRQHDPLSTKRSSSSRSHGADVDDVEAGVHSYKSPVQPRLDCGLYMSPTDLETSEGDGASDRLVGGPTSRRGRTPPSAASLLGTPHANLQQCGSSTSLLDPLVVRARTASVGLVDDDLLAGSGVGGGPAFRKGVEAGNSSPVDECSANTTPKKKGQPPSKQRQLSAGSGKGCTHVRSPRRASYRTLSNYVFAEAKDGDNKGEGADGDAGAAMPAVAAAAMPLTPENRVRSSTSVPHFDRGAWGVSLAVATEPPLAPRPPLTPASNAQSVAEVMRNMVLTPKAETSSRERGGCSEITSPLLAALGTSPNPLVGGSALSDLASSFADNASVWRVGSPVLTAKQRRSSGGLLTAQGSMGGSATPLLLEPAVARDSGNLLSQLSSSTKASPRVTLLSAGNGDHADTGVDPPMSVKARLQRANWRGYKPGSDLALLMPSPVVSPRTGSGTLSSVAAGGASTSPAWLTSPLQRDIVARDVKTPSALTMKSSGSMNPTPVGGGNGGAGDQPPQTPPLQLTAKASFTANGSSCGGQWPFAVRSPALSSLPSLFIGSPRLDDASLSPPAARRRKAPPQGVTPLDTAVLSTNDDTDASRSDMVAQASGVGAADAGGEGGGAGVQPASPPSASGRRVLNDLTKRAGRPTPLFLPLSPQGAPRTLTLSHDVRGQDDTAFAASRRSGGRGSESSPLNGEEVSGAQVVSPTGGCNVPQVLTQLRGLVSPGGSVLSASEARTPSFTETRRIHSRRQLIATAAAGSSSTMSLLTGSRSKGPRSSGAGTTVSMPTPTSSTGQPSPSLRRLSAQPSP